MMTLRTLARLVVPVAPALLAACATTSPPPSQAASAPQATPPSQAAPGPSASSPVGPRPAPEGMWTLTFVDDRCVLTGSGARADSFTCEGMRAEPLPSTLGEDLGGRVQGLSIATEDEAGGARAILDVPGITYRLKSAEWGPLLAAAKFGVAAAKVAEREARFTDLPSCPPGQVVVAFNPCPGVAGVSDVCGQPTHTCGAPLAKGAACQFHRACASQRCGWPVATCE